MSMNPTVNEIVEELLNSYIDQKKDTLKLISINIDKIKEIDYSLSDTIEKSDDLKIFSPRNQDEIYGEKINEETMERDRLLSENISLNKSVDELSLKIEQFRNALEITKIEASDNELSSEINSSNLNELFIDIQEKDRNRIASDLHDTTIQNLVHLIHSIELSSLFIDSDPLRAKLELAGCINNLKSTIDGIRETIFNLRPMSLNDLGLKKCIDDFITNMIVHYPSVYFEADIDEIDINQNLSIGIFRIIQECIINSLKHSGSDKVNISLHKFNDSIDIIERDFGKGFCYDTIDSNHFGLSIMEERIKLLNGSFSIRSESDFGTEIHISIPL